MGKIERSKRTDEELEALGIQIPESETDASFFGWLENMIQEEFKDVAPEEE